MSSLVTHPHQRSTKLILYPLEFLIALIDLIALSNSQCLRRAAIALAEIPKTIKAKGRHPLSVIRKIISHIY